MFLANIELLWPNKQFHIFMYLHWDNMSVEAIKVRSCLILQHSHQSKNYEFFSNSATDGHGAEYEQKKSIPSMKW
jgi:hypothetical protein